MNKAIDDEPIVGINAAPVDAPVLQAFADDVHKGLSASPKALSSRYFYDAEGDKLFQRIMELDEYYLTRTEYGILESNKEKLRRSLYREKKPFHLIEFGAGDGYKTKILLRHFTDHHVTFDYRPIDISANVLHELEASLKDEIPLLETKGMQGEYFEVLERMKKTDTKAKVVLFLGSNIGNFSMPQAVDFLGKLRNNLNPGDKVLIGFDLKKDPHMIRNAYDDPQGITSAFNLNLLRRINRELGGDFQLDAFKHFQSYDPTSGECRSYLISLKDQEVYVDACAKTYRFKKWEPLHVEVSRKFDSETIHSLASKCGFEVEEDFTDSDQLFVDSLWVA